MPIDDSSNSETRHFLAKIAALRQNLLKVLKDSTDGAIEMYLASWLTEFDKTFKPTPNSPAYLNEYRKNHRERELANISTAIKIIRNCKYYTSWCPEWLQEDSFKDLCLLSILLPSISPDHISGYYLIALIHGDQINLFDFDKLYQADLPDNEKINNKSKRFKRFKNRVAKELGVEIPCMTQYNEYAKQLAQAYEYCKEIHEERSSTSTQSSPLKILNTDLTFEESGFLELDLSRKISLFFKTVAYTMLPLKMQALATGFTLELDKSLKSAEILLTIPLVDKLCSIKRQEAVQTAKEIAERTENPCFYIYCLLSRNYKERKYARCKKYLQLLQNGISSELTHFYSLSAQKYKFTPIGWQKSFGPFIEHQLTPAEIKNCNKCTWSEFYKSNKDLIDSFFRVLLEKDRKNLWDTARKAIVYCNPPRFNFDMLKENVPKTPKETWYKEHNVNAKITINELISMMYLINTLKDIDAKDFWHTSYKNRHSSDTFGSMVRNIGSHNYPPFISDLYYLMNVVTCILIKDIYAEPMNDIYIRLSQLDSRKQFELQNPNASKPGQ